MEIKEKWNAKYTDRIELQKAVKVNERLIQLSHYLNGGSALDLACGQGGNSVFLAQLYYKVKAIDISDVAIGYLREQASKLNLDISADVSDLSKIHNSGLNSHTFDLVLITYYLNRSLFPLIKKIVKNNGYFFMETLYKTPIKQERYIPDEFKLDPKELLNEFQDWEVLFFEESEAEGRQTLFCRKPAN